MMDDIWKTDLYNVGVIGKTGAGKSTLINAYFGFPRGSEEAAKSDVVECTQTPQPYHLPGSQLVLWDTPGFGSPKVPADDSYFDKFHFRDYDFYILVSCNKINEFDLKVFETIRQMDKRAFYVRAKVEQEIRGLSMSHQKAPSKDSVVQEIRAKIGSSFPETPVFLVESLKKQALDFPDFDTLAVEAARLSTEEFRLAEFKTRAQRNSNPATAKKCIIL